MYPHNRTLHMHSFVQWQVETNTCLWCTRVISHSQTLWDNQQHTVRILPRKEKRVKLLYSGSNVHSYWSFYRFLCPFVTCKIWFSSARNNFTMSMDWLSNHSTVRDTTWQITVTDVSLLVTPIYPCSAQSMLILPLMLPFIATLQLQKKFRK